MKNTLIAAITSLLALTSALAPAKAWTGDLLMSGRTSEGHALGLTEAHNVYPNREGGMVRFTYVIDLAPDSFHSDAIKQNTAIVNCNDQSAWYVYKQVIFGEVEYFAPHLIIKPTSNVSRSLIKSACSLAN